MIKNKRNKLIAGFIILLVVLTTVTFIHNGYANNNGNNGEVKEEHVNEFEKLFVILDIIEQNYVEEKDMETLVNGAIDGMLNALDDPYTNYLPPKEFEGMKEDFEGEYGGIGIMITLRSGKLTVVSAFKGTPGDKAGVESGDIIHKINDQKTEGMQLKEAVDLMRGKPGTDVTLTIKKSLNKDITDPDEQNYETSEVEITRAEIEVPYVNSELKEDNIGYIELTRFIEDAGTKVEESIAELDEEGADAFILDLRNNPGGLLEEASKVASNFVDQGPVVYVKERGKEKQAVPLAKDIKTTDKPLVILVNEGSASASEIVTGVVKDNERGTVVGTKTFGKGVVQSLVPLTDDSAVKMTTARYYTPEGTFINHKGIKPDVKIEATDNPDNSDLLQTKNAQKILKAVDYYDGKADGIYGPKTSQAILQFQRDNELEVTGVIDSATEEQLAEIASRKDVQEAVKEEDKQLNRGIEILKEKL